MKNENVMFDEKNSYCIELVAVRKKGVTKDGRDYDFLAFHSFDKKGKRAKIKFVKGAKNVPNKEGNYEAVILRENMNKDKRSKFDEYWVKAIEILTDYIPKFEVEDLDF